MNQIKQMEHMTEALGRRPPLTNTAAVEKADPFYFSRLSARLVHLSRSLALTRHLRHLIDRQLSINSSNRSSDTSITAAVCFRPLCIKRPQMSDRAPDLAVAAAAAVITPDISP